MGKKLDALRSLLYEQATEKQHVFADADQPQPLSKEEKRAFVEAVKNFSMLGETVYGKGNLREMCERVKDIVDKAQRIVSEDKDWFDNVTVSRHMKNVNESYKIFEKTAQEMSGLQQRLEAAYEDIAEGLKKYYEVG